MHWETLILLIAQTLTSQKMFIPMRNGLINIGIERKKSPLGMGFVERISDLIIIPRKENLINGR
jgi:hypothetical protein